MLRIVASYSCCVPSERVARYASTFGAVSWSDAALKRSSTASAFNVSVAAEAICVSSLVVRATRTSSRSFWGSGKRPRAAAKRAGCGALPLIMAWTTGFVDVISADKEVIGPIGRIGPIGPILGVDAVALFILLARTARARLVASDFRLVPDHCFHLAIFLAGRSRALIRSSEFQ